MSDKHQRRLAIRNKQIIRASEEGKTPRQIIDLFDQWEAEWMEQNKDDLAEYRRWVDDDSGTVKMPDLTRFDCPYHFRIGEIQIRLILRKHYHGTKSLCPTCGQYIPLHKR